MSTNKYLHTNQGSQAICRMTTHKYLHTNRGSHAIHSMSTHKYLRTNLNSHSMSTHKYLRTNLNSMSTHHHHHQSLNREGRSGTTDDFATSFLHFFPVLQQPMGLAELQACSFPDVVFPPLPLSALSSFPLHCALQDGFSQT